MQIAIIRASADYGLVIAVKATNITHLGATYYRCADWQIGEQSPDQFHEISSDDAMGYYSGQADGLGFGVPPPHTFATLDEAFAYRESCRTACRNERARNMIEACYDYAARCQADSIPKNEWLINRLRQKYTMGQNNASVDFDRAADFILSCLDIKL